jgi:hypothetical protein
MDLRRSSQVSETNETKPNTQIRMQVAETKDNNLINAFSVF